MFYSIRYDSSLLSFVFFPFFTIKKAFTDDLFILLYSPSLFEKETLVVKGKKERRGSPSR